MAYKAVSETRIYKDVTTLLNMILDYTPAFPRAYRYTVGQQMQSIVIEMISNVAAAYLAHDKQKRAVLLRQFQAGFETLKVLVRIAGERRWIPGRKAHAEIIELMANIGRQSSAWMKTLGMEEPSAAGIPTAKA